MSIQICHEEAEARRRMICPALPPHGDGGPSLCAGADCMAWRWVETHIKNPANPHGDLIPSSDTHGYCGLAGKP